MKARLYFAAVLFFHALACADLGLTQIPLISQDLHAWR